LRPGLGPLLSRLSVAPQQALPAWFPEDPGACAALADAIVALHFAVVAFVLVGEGLILLGGWRGWRWVGNRWLRATHLALIAFIAGQAALDRICPLTLWEAGLRHRAGEPVESAGFIARWLHELVFVDVPQPVLNVCYVAFAALVLDSLWLVPVRWRRERSG